MAQIIKLVPGEWESIMVSALKHRDSFDKEMFEIIKGVVNQDVQIYFPETLSTADRYKIHTFSKVGLITSRSVGEGSNRQLICNMTKKYVKIMYDTYHQDPEPVPVIKNKVFEDLLQIILTSFPKEFEEFLKSI